LSQPAGILIRPSITVGPDLIAFIDERYMIIFNCKFVNEYTNTLINQNDKYKYLPSSCWFPKHPYLRPDIEKEIESKLQGIVIFNVAIGMKGGGPAHGVIVTKAERDTQSDKKLEKQKDKEETNKEKKKKNEY